MFATEGETAGGYGREEKVVVGGSEDIVNGCRSGPVTTADDAL